MIYFTSKTLFLMSESQFNFIYFSLIYFLFHNILDDSWLKYIMKTTRKQRFIALPGLKATSCLTVVLLIFLETVLLSTVSNCAKTFFMHWNTSNSM